MDIYEKKYKEALGWMQSLYSSLHGAILEDAEHYFPELKESEDERISREITDFICWATDRGCITKEQVEKSNSWLAWLEKQTSPLLSNSLSVGKKVPNPCSDCTNEETPTIAWNENDEVALESAATNYAQDKYLPVQTAQAFKAGAAWQRKQLGSKEE